MPNNLHPDLIAAQARGIQQARQEFPEVYQAVDHGAPLPPLSKKELGLEAMFDDDPDLQALLTDPVNKEPAMAGITKEQYLEQRKALSHLPDHSPEVQALEQSRMAGMQQGLQAPVAPAQQAAPDLGSNVSVGITPTGAGMRVAEGAFTQGSARVQGRMAAPDATGGGSD